MYRIFSFGIAALAALIPAAVFAHEMYVLPPSVIAQGLAADSPNPFSAISGNMYQFAFWGFVSFVVVSTVALATVFHLFERQTMPFFHAIKRLAHPLVRAGVGACLISFGYHGALFGPEFPLTTLFGSFADIAEIGLFAAGGLILAGYAVRYTAIALIALWAYAGAVHGIHVLNYTDFLGAFIALLFLGAGDLSIDHLTGSFVAARKRFMPYARFAFPALRISFGFGVMFAAFYAKYLHSQLAVDVVVMFDLTKYFPFDPLFVVLGALIIEFIAGLMLFFGVAIRWTGVFLLFWLTLSQLYFTEAVWPHLILFFLGLALFAHGYDRYSLEGRIFKKKGTEPML